MAQEWDIKARSSACTECETEFADRQTCFSTLAFGEDGYVRSDFCENCWKKVESGLSAHSVWQGAYKMPPPPAEEPLKKETAESLLRKLMEDDDAAQNNVRYILAVMLERKKVLIERDVKTDEGGDITRFYEHRKTGETFVVPDPRLQLDALEQTQIQVMEMLGVSPPCSTSSSDAAQSSTEPDPNGDPGTSE